MFRSALVCLCALTIRGALAESIAQQLSQMNADTMDFLDYSKFVEQALSPIEPLRSGHHSMVRRQVPLDAGEVCCNICSQKKDKNGCDQTINRATHVIDYDESEVYTAKCSGISPSHEQWPNLPSAVHFETVELVGCPPPSSGSYVDALKKHNIYAKRLKLVQIPPDSLLTAASLAQAPASLVLSSFKTFKVAEGAINILDKRVKHLVLINVNLTAVSDHLPTQLYELELQYTGIKSLPAEAFAVSRLTINEHLLLNMGGVAPDLTSLIVHSPVTQLPHAPQLKGLWLHGAATNYLQSLKLDIYPLESLNVNGRVQFFPANFLKNLTKLRYFDAEGNGLEELNYDLFSETPNLYYVDLSHNKLEFLPGTLFSGLTKLSLVRLDNNQLSLQSLVILSEFSNFGALRQLRLRNNPLRNQCQEGGHSFLSFANADKLEVLDLTGTNLTRVCVDWVQMPALRSLYLNNNQLTEFPCKNIPSTKDQSLTVEVKGNNNLKCVVCQHLDDAQKVKMVTDKRCRH